MVQNTNSANQILFHFLQTQYNIELNVREVKLSNEMQIRQQMLLTLVNSAVIIWMIWIMGGGREKEEAAARGAAGKGGEGERGHKEKVGTDVEVMQVLRKLQASQVKHLNQAASSQNKRIHL